MNERDRRGLELLLAPDSRILGSVLMPGYVVVIDGRSGKDACAPTTQEAVDVLLDEIDGLGSPGRLEIVIGGDGAPALEVEHPTAGATRG